MTGYARRALRAGAFAVAFMAAAQASHAQEWPAEPIRFLVGFGAGGANDLIARALAPHLSEALGVPVVVENRPGAGSMIAMTQVANSEPDGYTIALAGATPMSINPHTQEEISYDSLRDFIGVSTVALSTLAAAVHPSVEARSLSELRDLARETSLTSASTGVGGIAHLAMEQFNQAAGVSLENIPYSGGAEAAVDVIGGHVDSIFMDFSPLRSHADAGQLRIIGVMSEERSTLLPDVPTAREQGFEDMVALSWFGIVVPAGTPDDIVARLHGAIGEATGSDDIREQFAGIGMEPFTMDSPEEFADFLAREFDRWGQIAEKAGLRIER